jgi:cell division protein FtsQ
MTVKQKKPVKRKIGVASSGKKRQGGFFFASVLPFLLLCLVLFCLGFVGFMLYQNMKESLFFSVKNIEINETKQIPKEEIERIVRIETAGKSIWDADVSLIKEKIEGISLVKEAVVSKILPNTIKVTVIERTPQLVAQIDSSYFWIDDEAKILKKAKREETNWILLGLEKNDKTNRENQERVKVAIKIKEEFNQIGIDDQIKTVNLSNLSEPQILVEDSGETVTIFLGKDNFGKAILKALEVLRGRGKEIEAVVLQKEDVIIRFRQKF